MPKSHGSASSRKRKRQSHGTAESIRRWLGRHARALAGSALALALIVGAFVLLDPYAEPTAIDADGQEVRLGPIETLGAAPRTGSQSPNFILADYDGNAVRLEDFRGKVVFLNFWATWCTACEAEMPDMNRLAEQHPDELVVLAVNRGEGKDQAKRWSDARNLDRLQFLIDPAESISGIYRLPNSMPVSFFIDADGFVTRVVPGAQSLAMMEAAFQQARSASPESSADPGSDSPE